MNIFFNFLYLPCLILSVTDWASHAKAKAFEAVSRTLPTDQLGEGSLLRDYLPDLIQVFIEEKPKYSIKDFRLLIFFDQYLLPANLPKSSINYYLRKPILFFCLVCG